MTTFPLVAVASCVDYVVRDFINVFIAFSLTLYTVCKSTDQVHFNVCIFSYRVCKIESVVLYILEKEGGEVQIRVFLCSLYCSLEHLESAGDFSFFSVLNNNFDIYFYLIDQGENKTHLF